MLFCNFEGYPFNCRSDLKSYDLLLAFWASNKYITGKVPAKITLWSTKCLSYDTKTLLAYPIVKDILLNTIECLCDYTESLM